jgi:hypothetical protein
VILIAVVFVVVGRAERKRSLDQANGGIDGLHAQLVSQQPSAYRLTPTLACLLYPWHKDVYAYELCYTLDGWLVEAIDRHTLSPKFWDITYDPGAARIHVAPARLSATLRRLGAFDKLSVPVGSLPAGLPDNGPLQAHEPYSRPLGS